jgi:hypothetical protein
LNSIILPSERFYTIKSKRENRERLESNCKTCKRKQRNKNQRFTSAPKEVSQPLIASDRRFPTEPIKPSVRATKIIEPIQTETNDLMRSIDFTLLESSSGKTLNCQERLDAVKRFNELIMLLRNEYSKQVGCEVYLES